MCVLLLSNKVISLPEPSTVNCQGTIAVPQRFLRGDASQDVRGEFPLNYRPPWIAMQSMLTPKRGVLNRLTNAASLSQILLPLPGIGAEMAALDIAPVPSALAFIALVLRVAFLQNLPPILPPINHSILLLSL